MTIHSSCISRITLTITVLLCSVQSIAQNNESKAFNTLNLNPLIQIFGLPSLDNTVLSKQGASEVILEQQVANYYSSSILDDEAVKLDGETWRTNVAASYAITDNSTISLSIPYIRHAGGHLDNLIYEWHDTFDLPQGGRHKDTNDEIDIRYINDNELIVSQRSATNGIGDIRLKYGYALPVYGRSLILQGELKFPTGNIDRLTGSEGTDFSAGFLLNDTISLSHYNIDFWYGGATSYLEDAKGALSNDQHNLALSGRAGMSWHVTDSIALKTQLDTHTEIYDSETDELGRAAFMLTFGGDISFYKHYRLELSAVEDLITSVSPDIIFTAKLSANIF